MLLQICLLLIGTFSLFVHWKNRKFYKIAKKIPVVKMKRVPILEHTINFFGNGEVHNGVTTVNLAPAAILHHSKQATSAQVSSTDLGLLAMISFTGYHMTVLKEMGEQAMCKNDGMVSLWLGHKFLVMVTDPAAAEVIMKTCLEKDEMMNVAHKLLGNGSIFAPVSIWRHRRKVLAPNFGQKTLNGFVKIFTKKANILTEKLKASAGQGNFSLFEKVTKCAMDSVYETVLGYDFNSQDIMNHPIFESYYNFCEMAVDRMLKPWLYLDLIYKWHWNYPKYESSANVVKQFVSKIIESKRQSLDEWNNKSTSKYLIENCTESELELTKPKSLLENLMELGEEKGFSDLEIQEEIMVMLLAGTDTSSVAISFTALLLAKYPHIQETVYQEIIQGIGDTNIEPKDLPNLKYLEAVLKESMRLYPPGPYINRMVNRDVTLPSGVTLVAGVGVIIDILAIHRNPKYWGPDAKVFRPERFLEGPLKHPFAFIPFSSGLRNCLGYQYAMMSMKTVMAHLIRRYRILPAKKPDGVIETYDDSDIPVSLGVMMKHTGNFQIRLELRN